MISRKLSGLIEIGGKNKSMNEPVWNDLHYEKQRQTNGCLFKKVLSLKSEIVVQKIGAKF